MSLTYTVAGAPVEIEPIAVAIAGFTGRNHAATLDVLRRGG